MNQSKILLAVIEGAKVGPVVTAEEALSLLASVISRLDMYSDNYQKDMSDHISIENSRFVQASISNPPYTSIHPIPHRRQILMDR